MKTMKQFGSLLLALALILSLSVSVFAAEDKGSITITNPVSGQDYSAYQILTLESYNKDSGAYSYKATAEWKTWLEDATGGAKYVATDAQGYVTWIEGADVVAFAAEAQAQLTGKTPAANGTAGTGELKFSDLALGYYLVDTTLGALCSLDTTDPDVEMEEKNEAPTLTKQVKEDDAAEGEAAWGAYNDADINQVVEFEATIAVKAGAENYVLHDKMDAGLTLVADSIKVTVDGTGVAAANYTVKTEGLTDGCDFEIAFDDDYVLGMDEKTIVVNYSAVLNEEAVVGINGNNNIATLTYGESTDLSVTPDASTKTYTWDAKVIKYTMKNNEEVKLAEAIFEVTDSEADDAVAFKFHALGENKYEYCADDQCEGTHVTTITTDSTGTFVIEGLDSGTYYLKEIEAPAGYNVLAGPVSFVVEGEVNDEYKTVETKVENKTGAELPATGGVGTTIFYVLGGCLAVGAGVLLVTKKRMGVEE